MFFIQMPSFASYTHFSGHILFCSLIYTSVHVNIPSTLTPPNCVLFPSLTLDEGGRGCKCGGQWKLNCSKFHFKMNGDSTTCFALAKNIFTPIYSYQPQPGVITFSLMYCAHKQSNERNEQAKDRKWMGSGLWHNIQKSYCWIWYLLFLGFVFSKTKNRLKVAKKLYTHTHTHIYTYAQAKRKLRAKRSKLSHWRPKPRGM